MENIAPRCLVVGLTGGIGCGKSTVADHFAALGAGIVDADIIAHQLTAPGGAAMPILVETFGAAIRDASGGLDRSAMRQIVFTDPAQRQRLEHILHPLIREAMEQQVEALSCTVMPYVLLVVPLLFESLGWRKTTTRTVAVDCAESTQIRRVMRRSGLDETEVRRIMATQVPRAIRLQLADDVICNERESQALAAVVHDLHQRYVQLTGVS